VCVCVCVCVCVWPLCLNKLAALNEYSVVRRRLQASRINYPVLQQYLRNEDHNIYGNLGCNGPAVNRITFTKKELLLALLVVL